MPKVFVTRKVAQAGIDKLSGAGYEVEINPQDKVLSKEELIYYLREGKYDAVFCLLTDKIDKEVFEAAGPQCKIFGNMAVGFDNIDVPSAKEKKIMVTNTPGVLTDTVAEHTFALILSIARRISEGDRFARAGKYHGWEPMMLLGADISKKTLGIVGLGRIGSRVAHHAVKGFEMNVLYYDVKRNEEFEKESGVDSAGSPQAKFCATVEEVLKNADFVSIHVPLMPETQHLINAERLKMMKKTAYLVNTSRGPIVDEKALAEALKAGVIRGAAIDVFEHEPAIEPELLKLENVIMTPHIASATEETRAKMAELAADNIIAALSGQKPPNLLI
ncbi:D-glycerate dehydrogenase [Candidatus Giovannonibacteria bacterium RIFCSPLOWO2_01_FULL_46_13]|uniref:D-glycerate dehydrogenase n=1 Tax=Candidatus Giovannonibacteria bacterium RIFCSPLOWO2_01_FULL_46_13 TaxID=1798352 RepID=A0A1F5X499_9BACT|nr:MAG: D-glycerate dehydrogenase [Candidatus Giovannonibacteria bacterium RIFCSPLOWO2_01_FULL_46_13]